MELNISSGKPAILGGKPILCGDSLKWPIVEDRERQLLLEVLESRIWSYDGPKETLFVSEFCKFIGSNYGVAVANGTVSLEIALRACGIGAGDEVIVPALTWIATASSVVSVGANPVLVDIEADTLCIDPKAIESAITERTKAIIPVHLYGRMANMDEIQNISKKYNLWIIEDVAHSHGSQWRGKGAGSIGHFGSFSFQMSKVLTGGEGGFVSTNDAYLADLCYSYKNCGRKRGAGIRDGKGNNLDIMGNNYRITEFQAAILLAQLERLDEQTKVRNKNAHILDESLSKIEGITTLLHREQVTRQAYYMYAFRYDPSKFSDIPVEVMLRALKQEGILTHETYTPLYRNSLFPVKTNVKSNPDFLPETEHATKDVILLQHKVLLEPEAISIVPEAIRKIQLHSKEIRNLCMGSTL